MTTTPQRITTLNFGSATDHRLTFEDQRQTVPTLTSEERLTNKIFQGSGGKQLIKFCRELSNVLIRSYNRETGAGELRDKLVASIMVTLNCSEKQSLCLVELALELVHAKVHGTYRRTEVELSYLIATATGAVHDVSSN